MTSEPEIHARLDPSPLKRWVALIAMGGVGATLLFAAARATGGFGVGSLMMLAAAIFFFWAAHKVYHATSGYILLTDEGLTLDDGTILAAMENIKGVDRGMAAFKPSNGFAVSLHKTQPGGWSPGLWWGMGRTMGFGGATNRDQGRFMAETLQRMIDPPSENMWQIGENDRS